MSKLVIVTAVFTTAMSVSIRTQAVNRDWDGGGGDNLWSTTANWDPNGDPGDDDLTIAGLLVGAGPHTVLDTDFVVASLAISNSAEVDTNNFLLAVEGDTTVNGAGTLLQLFERTSPGDTDSLDTDSLGIINGGVVEMYENSVLEVDDGVLSVLGTLVGNGELELNDNPAVPSSLINIAGVVRAGEPGSSIGAPPARTLTIKATDSDARFGMTNAGLIEVLENATLNNEVRMQNDRLANLRLWPNSTYHVAHSWHLRGDITISTGLGSRTDPATLSGGASNPTLTLDSASTVTVDEDESLRFALQLSADNGSAVVNRGTVIFDEIAQFDQMADLRMLGDVASLVVNAPVSITQNAFHLDGNDNLRNTITVNSGGVLTVDVNDIDISDDVADGTIVLNSGVLEVGVTGLGWTMDGVLELNNSDDSPAVLRKVVSPALQSMFFGDGNGVGDATVVVQGTGESVVE